MPHKLFFYGAAALAAAFVLGVFNYIAASAAVWLIAAALMFAGIIKS